MNETRRWGVVIFDASPNTIEGLGRPTKNVPIPDGGVRCALAAVAKELVSFSKRKNLLELKTGRMNLLPTKHNTSVTE